MLFAPLIALAFVVSPTPRLSVSSAHRRGFSPCASAAEPEPRAFLTREDGKNGKLRKLLTARGVACEELPCIAFQRLPGFEELQPALKSGRYEWVAITSPEAAGVFVEARASCGDAAVAAKVASVGAGTAQVLAGAGVPASFVPSKATGKTLAAELPEPSGEGRVLYPASALAADVVANGLAGRGIPIDRIDTYTTVPAEWSEADLARASACAVVTFGSPSAVRVWAERVGTAAAAVCIGETSAKEARRVRAQELLYTPPRSPHNAPTRPRTPMLDPHAPR